MKHTFVILLVVSHGLTTSGQSSFERIYEGATSFKYNMTELPSGRILAGLGRTRAISHIDSLGEITYTHSYWALPEFPLTGIGGVRQHSANEYIFTAGCRLDSCGQLGLTTVPYFHPVLGKIDSVGNILALRYYELNLGCRNIGSDITVTGNGDIIAWGHELDYFVLRTNSELVPQFAKRFIGVGGVQFVKELPSGDILAGINMQGAGGVLVRMDASGNFIWCKSYMRPKGMVHDAVIESDSSYTITGYTDSTSLDMFTPLPPSFQPKLFLMNIGGDGEVHWCKGYESATYRWYTPQSSRIEKLIDGNYMIMSNLGYADYNFHFRPILMKISPSADTLWTRAIGAAGYSYQALDLLAHSTGDYLISGVIHGELPGLNSALPFMYRMNSSGQLPCSDTAFPIQIWDLFPTDSSFTLTAVDGATVHSAIVSDTTFATIDVFDACEIANGFAQRPMRRDKRTTIRPNPNTGRFTVQFTDPLIAESYYSVYDAVGKLLFQRPLPKGRETEEVDLSRFGAGTYVIRFTDKEGSCYERVVVE